MSEYRVPTVAEWDGLLKEAMEMEEIPSLSLAIEHIAENRYGWERKKDENANPILPGTWRVPVDTEAPASEIRKVPSSGKNGSFDRSYIHIVVTPEMGGLERGVNLNSIMMEASRLVRERIGDSANVASILTMNPFVSLAHLGQIDGDVKKGRTTPTQSQVNEEN